jgi:hypothetical protein
MRTTDDHDSCLVSYIVVPLDRICKIMNKTKPEPPDTAAPQMAAPVPDRVAGLRIIALSHMMRGVRRETTARVRRAGIGKAMSIALYAR